MMQKFAERERVGLVKLLDVIEGIQLCVALQPKMSPTDDANQHTNYYCCLHNEWQFHCLRASMMRLPRVMQCEDAFTAA